MQESNLVDSNTGSSTQDEHEGTFNALPLSLLFKFIKPFNGSRNELTAFLQSTNSAFQIAQPNQIAHLFLYVVSQLSSEVVNDIEIEDVSSWTELKNKLKAYYSKVRDLTQLHEELETIRQTSHESITDFFKRLEKSKNACIIAETNQCEDPNELSGLKKAIQRTALRRFILHCKPEISQMLRARDIKNLNDAFSIATQEEKILNYTRNHKPSTSVYCSHCKLTNHSTQNCRKKLLKPKSEPQQPKINPPSYNGTKFCNYCKNKGHEISECRKRQFRENQRPNTANSPNPRVNQVNHDQPIQTGDIPKDTEIQHTFQVNSIQPNPDQRSVSFFSTNSDKKLSFLIDTGASISLIKHNSLNPKRTSLDIKDIITITGINPNIPITTVGSSEINLSLPKLNINFRINVINAYKISSPYDGILGDDFLRNQKAEINYLTKSIKIADVIIPFDNPEINKSTKITLPPRSETVIQIQIQGNVTEGTINANEIKDNILIPNALIKADDSKHAKCPLINLNDKEIEIEKPIVTLEEILQLHTINYVHKETVLVSEYQSQNRIKLLQENLRTKHMNEEEKNSLMNICNKYNDIFHLPNDILTTTSTVCHEIPTNTEVPIFTRTYRYPKIHEKEVNNQISEMLNQQIIQPSTSPYSSPLWVVPKKLDASGERKWRLVVDYRKLNEITIGDAYPLPNIEHILDQLGQAKYFSTLDLASGFHQISMSTKDKNKTSFSTPQGHYEFNRMPFGLKNAPATFQRLMNLVLSGLTGIKSFVYLDDIVVYGNSLQNHNDNLKDIFNKLREHNLKLQPDKCEFLRKEVAYLGHVISDEGIRPNPDKVVTIKEIRVPKNPKDIKSFLGLVGYYRKFIPNFSLLAKPLTTLLKKNQKFEWSKKCQSSFEELKNILTTEPLLQYPDFAREFLLTTDASNEAIGSILSQGPLGKDLPICYYSRTLNKAEQNYSTTEKELLSIVDSVKHFRPYLFGQRFTIITDHKPLVWLMNCKDPSSRLMRWRLKLMEYDYQIRYKPGKTNTNADALSRPIHQIINDQLTFNKFKIYHQQTLKIRTPRTEKCPINKVRNIVIPISQDCSDSNLHINYILRNFPRFKETRRLLNEVVTLRLPAQTIYVIVTKEFVTDSTTYENLFESLKSLKFLLEFNQVESFSIVDLTLQNDKIQGDTFNSLLQYIFLGYNYSIFNNDRKEITNIVEIENILKTNHDHYLAGHQGIQKTYEKIKRQYYWSNMKETIERYIKKCQICQKSKTNFKPNRSPMVITTTARTFCEQLAMDIVGPLPETNNGNRFILTLQDDLTKYLQAYALPEHSAPIVAIYFLKFCTQFGFPYSILTDQGKEFTSSTLKEINKLLTVKHNLCSPYHPESNGALERSHLTLKDYLRCYVNKDGNNWDEFLNFAIFTYNTSIHKSTQKTPYELVFGQLPRIPSNISKPNQRITYSDLARDLTNKFQTIRESARETQINGKEKSKRNYDKTHNREYNFKAGDQVLLSNAHAASTSKQLKPSFLGPYEIVQVHTDQKSASIRLTSNKIRTYNFKLLKPYVSDSSHIDEDE